MSAMVRALLTGMSGVGKSTLLHLIGGRDVLSVDLDYDDWIPFDPAIGERCMDIPRILALFAAHPNRHILLGGCAVNQRQLYPHLSAVITLTAPPEVMRQRILARTGNPYGKSDEEWNAILRNKAEVEPILMASSHLVCHTDRDITDTAAEICHFLGLPR